MESFKEIIVVLGSLNSLFISYYNYERMKISTLVN